VDDEIEWVRYHHHNQQASITSPFDESLNMHHSIVGVWTLGVASVEELGKDVFVWLLFRLVVPLVVVSAAAAVFLFGCCC